MKVKMRSMFSEDFLLYNPFCLAGSHWRKKCKQTEKCSRFLGDYKKCKRYIVTVKVEK